MNILREIRRISQKSKRKRIILIVLLCVTLLSSSYAWFAATKTTSLNGLSGQVNSWDVAYVISDTEVIDKEVSFDLSTIYPTMPTYEQNLHIYNLGEKGANIKLEIISVKLFGEEILDSLKEKLEITNKDNKIIIFDDLSNSSEYPFKTQIEYDKLFVYDKYEYISYDENGNFIDAKDPNGKYGYETNNRSVATIKMKFIWNGLNDTLDTEFGKKAFEYYQKSTENTEPVIRVKVRVTSSHIQ